MYYLFIFSHKYSDYFVYLSFWKCHEVIWVLNRTATNDYFCDRLIKNQEFSASWLVNDYICCAHFVPFHNATEKWQLFITAHQQHTDCGGYREKIKHGARHCNPHHLDHRAAILMLLLLLLFSEHYNDKTHSPLNGKLLFVTLMCINKFSLSMMTIVLSNRRSALNVNIIWSLSFFKLLYDDLTHLIWH